jgi:hypothetical protein
MRHDVDVPDALPFFVGHFCAAAEADARIGAEEINGSVPGFDRLDEVFDIRLFGDIGGEGDTADFLRGGRSTFAVQVGADDEFRAFSREPLSERPADPARSPGHHDNTIFDLHARLLPSIFSREHRGRNRPSQRQI